MFKKLFESENFKIVMRHLPTLTLVFASALALIYGRDMSFDYLLMQKPKGLLAAALFFFIIFAIKSMSYMVPIIVIFAAVGTLFPISIALAVNIIGAAIVVSIPYWLGYYHGAGFMGTLLSKFPKIELFIKKREARSWLVSCFPRTIVFVPVKTVSVYLGSLKIPFYKYLLGSIAGMLPMLVSVTFIGKNITDPHSPEFITALIIVMISAVASLATYFLIERHIKVKGS